MIAVIAQNVTCDGNGYLTSKSLLRWNVSDGDKPESNNGNILNEHFNDEVM